MTQKNSGRLSKIEQRKITEMIDDYTIEDIAKKLDRSYDAVNNYVKTKLKVGSKVEETAAYSLVDRPITKN